MITVNFCWASFKSHLFIKLTLWLVQKFVFLNMWVQWYQSWNQSHKIVCWSQGYEDMKILPLPHMYTKERFICHYLPFLLGFARCLDKAISILDRKLFIVGVGKETGDFSDNEFDWHIMVVMLEQARTCDSNGVVLNRYPQPITDLVDRNLFNFFVLL